MMVSLHQEDEHPRTYDGMLVEHDYLRPLATEGFDLAETFPIVDGMGCARVRTDFYSVPLRVGAVVEAKVYSTYGEMWLP